MRYAICVIALAMVSPVGAQPAALTPWMTGERLVKLLGNVDARTVHWTPDSPIRSRGEMAAFHDMVNGEFVHGYIQAVHDATEGKEWCWSPYKIKPDELESNTRRTLQQMTDAQLKRNAADLIVEYWRTKYPCPANAERSKK